MEEEFSIRTEIKKVPEHYSVVVGNDWKDCDSLEEAKALQKTWIEDAKKRWAEANDAEKKRLKFLERLYYDLKNYPDIIKRTIWHWHRQENISKEEAIKELKRIVEDLEGFREGTKTVDYSGFSGRHFVRAIEKRD